MDGDQPSMPDGYSAASAQCTDPVDPRDPPGVGRRLVGLLQQSHRVTTATGAGRDPPVAVDVKPDERPERRDQGTDQGRGGEDGVRHR